MPRSIADDPAVLEAARSMLTIGVEAARIRQELLALANIAGELVALADQLREILGGEYNHAHEWGAWKDDAAGVVRECACGAIDWRPEG